MTLLIETESHGEIDAGFYAAFTEFFRVGDYAFLTKSFSRAIRDIAENPDIKSGEIQGYTLEKFWKRFRDYLPRAQGAFIQSVLTGEDMGNREINESLSLEDELNSHSDSVVKVPLRINEDYQSVDIGEYKIPSHAFQGMAYYVAYGGHMGWEPGNEPDFAKPTLEAIKNSIHPIFKVPDNN